MKRSKRIALLALMLSLIVILHIIPIHFGPVSLGLMILPVLIIAQVEDFKMTLVVGIFLGIVNLISWYTGKAGSLLAPVFQNPLVCIFPRVMIGVVSYLVYHGLNKLNKPKYETIDDQLIVVNRTSMKIKEKVISIVATVCGVVTNTGLVGLIALALFHGKTIGGTAITIEWLATLFGINFIVEVIAFPLLVPAVVFALKKLKMTENRVIV